MRTLNFTLISNIFANAFTYVQNASFSDYATGFGGKYGVQTDHQDKSAVGWDHKEQASAHESQKGKSFCNDVVFVSIIR